ARPGGGADAADWLITTPVPRRSRGWMPSSAGTATASVRGTPSTITTSLCPGASPEPAAGAAARLPCRDRVGAGTVAQPDRATATTRGMAKAAWSALAARRNRGTRVIRRTLPLLGSLRLTLGLAQLLATRLDPL